QLPQQTRFETQPVHLRCGPLPRCLRFTTPVTRRGARLATTLHGYALGGGLLIPSPLDQPGLSWRSIIRVSNRSRCILVAKARYHTIDDEKVLDGLVEQMRASQAAGRASKDP